MVLVLAAVALLVTVPLAGGRLTRLADIRLRGTWAVLLSAAVQVAITTFGRGGSHALHVALHLGSYALAGWFLFANRRLPALPLVALGAGLNVLAISFNGGVMPASAAAMRIAGIHNSGGFANSAAMAHERLRFLGDMIPVPGPWPIGNVLSIGDLIIVVGAFLVLHRLCGSRLAGRTPVRRPAADPRPL